MLSKQLRDSILEMLGTQLMKQFLMDIQEWHFLFVSSSIIISLLFQVFHFCLFVFRISKVHKPEIGKKHPAMVRAEIKLTLNDCQNFNWKDEWDNLRQHDVLFLVSIVAKKEFKGREKESLAMGISFPYIFIDLFYFCILM